MHVALVRRFFTQEKGGAEGFSVLVARELVRLGWRVSVVAEKASGNLPPSIAVYTVPALRFKTFARHLLFLRAARRILNAIRPDRVLAFSRLDRADIFRSGDPLFIHWLTRHKPNLADRLLGWLNPKQRSMLQLEHRVFCSSHISKILALSRMDAALMRRYYGVPPSKIVILHNGYDPRRFNPEVRRHRKTVRQELQLNERPMLLFVGMDFKRKGLDLALGALARIRDATLVVAGSGDVKRFRALAQKLGVAERVRFLGRRRDIERLYGAADLLLLPTRYDPFCNAILEAMACGLGVVVTEDAGAAEVVTQEAGVVLGSDPEPDAVAAAVERVLNQKERFGEAAYRAASKYPISTYAEKLAQLLQT